MWLNDNVDVELMNEFHLSLSSGLKSNWQIRTWRSHFDSQRAPGLRMFYFFSLSLSPPFHMPGPFSWRMEREARQPLWRPCFPASLPPSLRSRLGVQELRASGCVAMTTKWGKWLRENPHHDHHPHRAEWCTKLVTCESGSHDIPLLATFLFGITKRSSHRCHSGAPARCRRCKSQNKVRAECDLCSLWPHAESRHVTSRAWRSLGGKTRRATSPGWISKETPSVKQKIPSHLADHSGTNYTTKTCVH